MTMKSNSTTPFVLVLLTCFNLCSCFSRKGSAESHGMFVFGSSLVDNGNNNFVENSTKADYLPYGIDFRKGPTGRYSNGMNVIDALGKQLKLHHQVPAFLHPKTNPRHILHGVDYASGGSGILDETGNTNGRRAISLNQQINNFKNVTLPNLEIQLRCNNTKCLSTKLSDFMFVLAAGGNDYFLNYFLQPKSTRPSLENFTAKVITGLSTQIEALYSLGATKFVLISVYPLGCIPFIKKTFNVTEGCLEILNQAAVLFNSQIKSLTDFLKPKMPGSNLVYINSYQVIMDILADPIWKGFKNTNDSCCEVPSLKEGGTGVMCKRQGSVCDDRSSYVFFDGLHPTEAVNNIIASKAYSSSLPTEVYPYNLRRMARSLSVS